MAGIEDIRPRDIRRSLQGLQFGQNIIHVDFSFQPTIALLAKKIDKLGLEFTSFKKVLTKAIVMVMIPSFRKNFEEGGRPEGWEPLAAYTIKRRGYDAWPILVRSGKLKRTATSLKIWDINPIGAIVKDMPSSVWYGSLHQAGYGGFDTHMSAAKAELGAGASERELSAEAFGSLDKKKAKRHAKVRIPARPFIMYQPQDIEAIQQLFYEWMSELVEEAQERA